MYPENTTGDVSMLSMATSQTNDPLTEKMTKLVNEKRSARGFQVRKYMDWNENYELYRYKQKTNRLTQRQAVNIPLMRETIKTLISKVDDCPEVKWKELSGDTMKELIYQNMWDEFVSVNKWEWIDILDKKNVFLYGLSTKKLNLDSDKHISMDVLDVYDVVYDPMTNPLNVETARFIIHQNIFRSLREILVDERYTKEGKDELRDWLASDRGMIQSGKNKIEWERKQERIRAMGVDSSKFPLYAGGDVIVHLTEHYTNIWNTKKKRFERHVVVYADDTIELCDDLLMDCIGIDLWPFVMWAEDPETNDIYPDGIADLVRTPNKILNVWFSQQVENRTLQNFQMHWFDGTQQGYVPQQYEPGPGRMLPAPGDPSKTIMPVAINGLDETFKAMDYLTNIVERGSGATALEKGESEKGRQTLGEVQVLVGKATERAKTMSKFYRGSAHDLAMKWDALMQANYFPKMSLYKTGRDGKVYEKVVYNTDWKSKAGYQATIESSSEQESDDLKNITKWQFIIQQSPNNPVLRQLALKRELKLLDLDPAELQEVQDAEEKIAMQAEMQAAAANQPKQPQGQQNPALQGANGAQQAMAQPDLSNEMAQLSQLVA